MNTPCYCYFIIFDIRFAITLAKFSKVFGNHQKNSKVFFFLKLSRQFGRRLLQYIYIYIFIYIYTNLKTPISHKILRGDFSPHVCFENIFSQHVFSQHASCQHVSSQHVWSQHMSSQHVSAEHVFPPHVFF